MSSNDIIYIAIVPPETVRPDLPEKVASIVNREINTVRRLLSARFAGLSSHYDSLREAEAAVCDLETLGLKVFLFNEIELRKPVLPFKAFVLKFGTEGISFRERGGQERKIRSKDAYLIVKGILETTEELEKINTTRKINLTVTLLTGGIPIRKTVHEKTQETLVHTEHFMRLYERRPSEICVEIRSHSFDFSCLGKEMTQSSLINFGYLATKLKSFFPGAFFIDGVRVPSGVTLPNLTQVQDMDITSRLIHKSHLIYGGCHAFRPEMDSLPD